MIPTALTASDPGSLAPFATPGSGPTPGPVSLTDALFGGLVDTLASDGLEAASDAAVPLPATPLAPWGAILTAPIAGLVIEIDAAAAAPIGAKPSQPAEDDIAPADPSKDQADPSKDEEEVAAGGCLPLLTSLPTLPLVTSLPTLPAASLPEPNARVTLPPSHSYGGPPKPLAEAGRLAAAAAAWSAPRYDPGRETIPNAASGGRAEPVSPDPTTNDQASLGAQPPATGAGPDLQVGADDLAADTRAKDATRVSAARETATAEDVFGRMAGGNISRRVVPDAKSELPRDDRAGVTAAHSSGDGPAVEADPYRSPGPVRKTLAVSIPAPKGDEPPRDLAGLPTSQRASDGVIRASLAPDAEPVSPRAADTTAPPSRAQSGGASVSVAAAFDDTESSAGDSGRPAQQRSSDGNGGQILRPGGGLPRVDNSLGSERSTDGPGPGFQPTAPIVTLTPHVTQGLVGRASAPIATPSSEPADMPADLPQQIVQTIRLQWADGGGQARVLLKPEYLGELAVNIQVNRGNVVVQLDASAPAVREWIAGHEGALRQALLDQGLQLDRLVVAADPSRASSPDEESRQRSSDPGQPREQRRRERHSNEDATFEAFA